MPEPAYRRILLKLSGEFLGEPDEQGGARGIGRGAVDRLARELAEVASLGVGVAVVVGGGNIFRGLPAAAEGRTDRVTGDYMGMLATLVNSLALEEALRRVGTRAVAMSAIPAGNVIEPYVRSRALECLEEGVLLILGGGTGNPYFSTDTAAALRAVELGAEALLKGTKVDGVYSADPHKDPAAERFSRLTYLECIEKNLRVADMTAFTLCMENNLPIVVFDATSPGNIKRVVMGEDIGTVVGGKR